MQLSSLSRHAKLTRQLQVVKSEDLLLFNVSNKDAEKNKAVNCDLQVDADFWKILKKRNHT